MHIKEAILNLYASKLRSSLALLGIIVGTASVVAMVSGGEIATNEALKQFKLLGTDLLAISLNATGEDRELTGKENKLSLSHASNIQKADHNILSVAPYTQLYQSFFYNGNMLNGLILGVTDKFADIVKIKMQAGRFISSFDKYEFYCVIGHEIYTAMKKISSKEPLGQQLQIGNYIFVIVGVAESWPENSFVYANVDNSILIPILASEILTKYATINNVIMRLAPEADIANVQLKITNFLNQFVTDKQISFRSAKELIAKMEQQNNILTIFLGLIGSISLIVGGIGVMNIMLVSVVERRREIGIRLAVGANRRDIAALFLMEAIMLAFIGGLIGVLLGIFIAYIIAYIWQWEFILLLWPALAGFSVSVIVGIFFGFYPAYQASRLDPIYALRSE